MGMARLITLVAVIASLVAMIAEVTNQTGSWVFPLDRGSYVLAVLAVVAALLAERRASAIVVGAQLAAAAAAVAFVTVALVKYYGADSSVFSNPIAKAYPWTNEAQLLGVAALAFALTLVRRRHPVAVAGLLATTLAAIGCTIYAITKKETFGAELWWWIATAAAFLAASAAAGLERERTVAFDAPVVDAPVSDPPVLDDPVSDVPASDAPVPGGASGESGSDPGVE